MSRFLEFNYIFSSQYPFLIRELHIPKEAEFNENISLTTSRLVTNNRSNLRDA